MPTVDLPGMRSISTDSACIARHRSSARPVTLLYFTPASGLNSNVVTTGPGDESARPVPRPRTRGTSPREGAPTSISSRSSILRSAFGASSSVIGGSVNVPGLRCAGRLELRLGSGRGGVSGLVRDDRRLPRDWPRQTSSAAAGRVLRSCGASPGAGSSPSARRPGRRPSASVLAMTSRRARSRRRSSDHPRNQPAPRADRSFELTEALANILPNENCVDRMTARMISVIRTMSEPVR